jgi:hypothetical protein
MTGRNPSHKGPTDTAQDVATIGSDRVFEPEVTVGIHQEVLTKGAPRYDMAGQSLSKEVIVTGESIKPGLVHRLAQYATKRMEEAGFPTTDRINVFRLDDYYGVDFVNAKGGMIQVVGILIGAGGHPSLDHGFEIQAPPRA